MWYDMQAGILLRRITMNILDETNETTFSQPTYNEEDISDETKRKINRLIKDDKAQLLRNDQYYESMRKTNLPLYRSAQVSEQRFRDAVRLGDKFYSEDQ
jgi:hypothetical protein